MPKLKKCICVCHDTEWNSSKLREPLEHETQCCEKMNGFLETLTKKGENYKKAFQAGADAKQAEIKVLFEKCIDKPELSKGEWETKKRLINYIAGELGIKSQPQKAT